MNYFRGCKYFKKPFQHFVSVTFLVFLPGLLFGQETSSAGLQDIVLGVLALTVIIVLFVVFITADKLLKISAASVNKDADQVSLIPSAKEILPKKQKGPEREIKLKRGFDIKIRGRAVKKIGGTIASSTYAIKPKDFIGMSPIPKLTVDVGDEVKAGDPLFFVKLSPDILYTSPVSGEVVDIKRGEKRSVAEVVILADKDIKFKEFDVSNYEGMRRDEIVSLMMQSGTWPMLRQRPFNVVADPEDQPKFIWISSFDSAPLAPNYSFTLENDAEAFQAGINVLGKLTEGKIYLGLDGRIKPAVVFTKAKRVEKIWFKGPHPAGNVGIQMHHVNPVSKGDVVWHIGPQDVVILGRLFSEGRYNTEKLVALAGPEVKEPQYYRTYRGANIAGLVKDRLSSEHVRYISGNVLTGMNIGAEGHIGFFDNLVSVIEEGDFFELFGWLVPTYPRPSLSPTFPWRLFSKEEFDVNTNTHGQERAYVVTGQYEKVLPMDIYPVHLIKAIMARDFELMEGLGIYEVVEEDLALCEFVCTSKVEVQHILREGLDFVRDQS